LLAHHRDHLRAWRPDDEQAPALPERHAPGEA
jgi:hypothetical protein